jgi:hypothetical protein
MKRFCGFPPTPAFTGDLEEMGLLAGESVGQTSPRLKRLALKRPEDAAREIVASMLSTLRDTARLALSPRA